jgi:excisionase family DNA binding protein
MQPTIESLGFSAGNLAKSLDVPRKQVDHAIKTGSLKAIRSGRRWIILKDDALAWLAECRKQGAIPAPVSGADREKLAKLNRARTASA